MRVISESCRRIEIEGANGEMVAAVEKIRVIEYETFDALGMYCVDTLEQRRVINLDRHKTTCVCGVAV